MESAPARSRSAPTTAPPAPPATSSSPSPDTASATAEAATATPESQAFIESWFAKLKERCVWLHEFETLDQARAEIAAYVDRYHDRPHSGLDYCTPVEVAQTWEDGQTRLTQAA